MSKKQLIEELKQAYKITCQYEGGYSEEFLDAKEFSTALNQAIKSFEDGDDSCVKDLWLWFAPTTAWDDFVGQEGIDLGNSIFEKLKKYIKKRNIVI